MRIVFGFLGLMIVLAIIGSVAKKQLQAVRALPSMPAAVVVPERDAAGVAASPREGGRLDAFPGAVAADQQGRGQREQGRGLHPSECRAHLCTPPPVKGLRSGRKSRSRQVGRPSL